MSAIGPGDWLEAVRAAAWKDGAVGIVAGSIYRCRALHGNPIPGLHWICAHFGTKVERAVELEEMPGKVWCPCSFKAGGYRPSEEIRRILDAPARVKERA